MMAKQTRKFPGIVMIARRTDRDAVKYERLVGGGTLAHILDVAAKTIARVLFLRVVVNNTYK